MVPEHWEEYYALKQSIRPVWNILSPSSIPSFSFVLVVIIDAPKEILQTVSKQDTNPPYYKMMKE